MIGVQGGRYHGAVTEINENEILVVTKEEKDEKGETVYITEPMDVNTLILGDYITYIGTESSTDLVEGGSLTTSTLYEWVGKSSDRLYMWKQDLMSEHCGGSLSDALAVSNESLAQNNSTAFQFLDHLTANSIFVNRLVANDAFIKNLFVKQIELQTEYNSDGTVKQYGVIYGGDRYDKDGNEIAGKEEAEGFHISSSGLIKANKAVLTNIEAIGGEFENITVYGKVDATKLHIDRIEAGNIFLTQFDPLSAKRTRGITLTIGSCIYERTIRRPLIAKGSFRLTGFRFYARFDTSATVNVPSNINLDLFTMGENGAFYKIQTIHTFEITKTSGSFDTYYNSDKFSGDIICTYDNSYLGLNFTIDGTFSSKNNSANIQWYGDICAKESNNVLAGLILNTNYDTEQIS